MHCLHVDSFNLLKPIVNAASHLMPWTGWQQQQTNFKLES